MASPRVVSIVCLVFLFCAVGESSGLTGTGDSPQFVLNTRWTSGVEDQMDLPLADRLTDCFPNPFNPLTRIRFELAKPTLVELKIYDLQGRLVRTLVSRELLPAGRYESEWNGRDERDAKAGAGSLRAS
jgi:hypothetical protein